MKNVIDKEIIRLFKELEGLDPKEKNYGTVEARLKVLLGAKAEMEKTEQASIKLDREYEMKQMEIAHDEIRIVDNKVKNGDDNCIERDKIKLEREKSVREFKSKLVTDIGVQAAKLIVVTYMGLKAFQLEETGSVNSFIGRLLLQKSLRD